MYNIKSGFAKTCTLWLIIIDYIIDYILDTWDWNGSTSGLTPWQTYDDNDDDDDDDDYIRIKSVPMAARSKV